MSSHKDTRIVWQVQTRKSRAHKWTNRGRYEVREDARWIAQLRRNGLGGYGFGNTRVIRIEVPHRATRNSSTAN